MKDRLGFARGNSIGVLAAGILALASTSALAADYGYPSPPPPASTWTQLRGGIGVGYGFGNHGISIEDECTCAQAKLDGLGAQGILGTAEIGFDIQVASQFVIGATGDYTLSDITSTAKASDGVDTFHAKARADNSYSVIGRAGFLANEDTLLYGLAGWTRTHWSLDANIDGADLIGNSLDFSRDGISVGAGVETRLTDHLSAKLEYRYTDYMSKSFGGDGVKVTVDPTVSTIRSVVSLYY